MKQNNRYPMAGIIGGPGYVDSSCSKTTDELFRISGNTGNLAFRYAVCQHITSPKKYISWSSNPEVVRKTCDILVFPAANQIDPRFNWQRQADFIEKVDLPCIVVGLGAQASILGSELSLQAGTIRWLKAISDRTHSIGVRGEYTADLLAKIGIKNTVVIGCPSNFISSMPNLGEVIEQKLSQPKSSLVITDSGARAGLKLVEQKLATWLDSHCGGYICQAPHELISIARNRWDEVPQEWLKRFHRYLLPNKSYEEFLLFIRQHFQVFFDVNAWMEFLSSFDVALGTRMHGNMLALQSSTPGICIYHDARTKELCQTMKIPNVSTEDFLMANDIDHLIEISNFKGKDFDVNRAKLAQVYRNILVGSELRVSDSLTALAKQEEGQLLALA